ncbi:helix-turn-helix domain-containing protein [Nocardia sp. NBC_01388]|uniref:helix-turn-helix domain-containing protein n=1 Tax=Nocardia sp. NBC_01388 TaxID=2903596 RepID=UPI0032478EC4
MSTVSRRAFGKFLRELREGAGKGSLAAGLRIEISKHTLLRLEAGVPTKIVTAQIGQLLDFYEVAPEVRVEALQLWGEVREQAKRDKLQGNSNGYWQSYTDQLDSHFPHYLRLETTATRVTTYQLVLMPGLLQTAGYRRAIVRISEPELSLVNVERRVELMEKRQERLQEPGFRMSALISEAVLRHRTGSSEIMAEQLRRLAELGERENIDIRVIPFEAEPHRGLTIQSFTLLEFADLDHGLVDPPVVYLEGALGALYHEQSDVIKTYRQAVSAVRVVALSEDDTRDMVLRIAKEYAP